MTDIKKLIQAMDAIESKKALTESAIAECDAGMAAPPIENTGSPVTVSVNFNASGKNNVADLLDMLKNAGLQPEGPAPAAAMPMRMDIEKFRDVVDSGDQPSPMVQAIQKSGIEEWERDPGIEDAERDDSLESAISMAVPNYKFTPVDHDTAMKIASAASKKSNSGAPMDYDNSDAFYDYLERRGLVKGGEMEEWANEPNEEYSDHKLMTKDLSGGINRPKKMYKPAAKGDNPMAVESIKDRLFKALHEKKSKPDFLDMDKDGNKKEPMKKAVADKKKVKEAAKPDFLDMDKDGNKKEPMKKAVKDKKKNPFKK
jgi:hypothetical protein